MSKRIFKLILPTLAAFVLSLCVVSDAFAQSLEEAARQAARQYNAKVLSARTVKDGDRQVHVIKLLTRDGVVKVVRVPVRNSGRR